MSSCICKLIKRTNNKRVKSISRIQITLFINIKILKRKLSGKRLKREEEREFARANQAANLALTYGKPAIVALAARGVGPRTATRLLRFNYEINDDLYRAILRAERIYARTHRFWD